MRYRCLIAASAPLILTAGCGGLDSAHNGPGAGGAPTEQELQSIAYMSTSNTGPAGRKVFDHLEQARTCQDFELAMRWNRPPNVEGGVFHKKMAYVTSSFPTALPKESEVVFSGKIDKGDALPSGSARWYLRMSDGTLVQAIENASFWQQQEASVQDAPKGQPVAIVNPDKPGRILCAHGVYQGLIGKDPDSDKKLPLVSVLFAMDRDAPGAHHAAEAHRSSDKHRSHPR